jgi:sarcosine oxidase
MNGYSRHYNTIVVGVGGMGSAACYELAKRGRQVLGIERFDIPNDMGSSHGYTRIIRLAYYEHPSYVMLIKRAYELWNEIERRSGRRLLIRTGSIDAGPAESWVFKGSLQSCVEHDLPHNVLSGAEINQRYPGYRLPHDIMGVFQPDGGFLLPEQAISAYVEAAHALGAEIHGRETVLAWEPLGDGVRVVTDRDEYEADSLVIAGGAWNADLLPELRGLAVPERQVLAWLQPERPELFTPERFPVFNLLVPEGRFYGFPVHSVPGFKFGKYHHFQEVVDPTYYDREPTLDDEELLRQFASHYFPQGTGPTMSLKACMFTNSPDKHFIIDLHPQYPQVSFAAGFTGHGYKFASVIGEVLADLAERRESRHNISLFNLARFTGRVSDLYKEMPGMQVRGRAMPGARASLRDARRQIAQAHRARTGLRREVSARMRTGMPRSQWGYRRRVPYSRFPMAHRRSGRLQPSYQTSDYDYFDTSDPRYWEDEDVRPFWL